MNAFIPLGKKSARPSKKDKQADHKPTLVLSLVDHDFTALCSQHFRRLGWNVHLAVSGANARGLVRHLHPDAVVLDTDLPDESGWLTCDKLMQENPSCRVVLVSKNWNQDNFTFANFAGAVGLVHQNEGIQVLVDEVYGKALSAL